MKTEKKLRLIESISFVIPTFNEETSIATCIDSILKELEKFPRKINIEVIVVDNKSSDRTRTILKDFAQADKRIKLILNQKNYGISKSPYYGILHAQNQVVIPMVADLQTPVSIIPALIHEWEAGFDIVCARRLKSGATLFYRFSQKIFYMLQRLFRRGDVSLTNFIGFGAFDQRVITQLRKIREVEPNFRNMVLNLGIDYSVVDYCEPKRKLGKSRQTFRDKLELGILSLFTSNSNFYRVFISLGFLGVIACLVCISLLLILKVMFWDNFAPGSAVILTSLFFLGSVNLFMLGAIGSLLGYLVALVKDTPLVEVDEKINFHEK